MIERQIGSLLSPSSLSVAFGNTAPVICGDSAYVGDWCNRLDYEYASLDAMGDHAPDCMIIMCTTGQWYNRLNELRAKYLRSKVLWMPFAAFHDENGPVDYGLAFLEKSDLRSAQQKQIAIVELLNKYLSLEVRDRQGGTAAFEVPQTTLISQAPRKPLTPGDFLSLISYFEVETEYASQGCEHLRAEGSLSIDCLLNARAPSNRGSDLRQAMALRLGVDVGEARSSVINLRDGFLSSLMIDGRDIAPEIAAMTGPRLGLRITEFSIGLNESIQHAEWTLNSPVNEGALGVHLGVGDGYSGLHFDFVCAMATIGAAA